MDDPSRGAKPEGCGENPARPIAVRGNAEAEPAKQDVVFVHSPTPDGDGLRVIRARDETIEIGEIRPMKEGRAILGDVVKLKPREGAERMFDVEVVLERPKPPALEASKNGPAQIASEAYRMGWDAIFGGSEPS